MKTLEKKIHPDEVMMVIDGTIGQQALIQAQTFHEATPIGSIIVTKLDGSARGGGALSAVAATGAPIKFIGTGEKIEDIEPFIPSRFVGRLLGMGDLETLLDKVHEAGLKAAVPVHGSKPHWFSEVRETISQYKDHPAVLCWMLYDEPGYNRADLLDIYQLYNIA
ncbi:MAG: hypothetical protein ACWGNP_01090, partial [Candidatus Bathyarchaeia archaeon]